MKTEPPQILRAAVAAIFLLCATSAATAPPGPQESRDEAVPQTGTLQGRVVDEEGVVLSSRWKVSVDRMDGEWESRLSFRAEDATEGRFRFDDLPEGVYRLTLYIDSRWWRLGPTVTVHAGETVDADVECRPPERADQFTVRVEGVDDLAFLPPDPSAVSLVAENGSLVIPATGTRQNGVQVEPTYTFGLPPEGPYTVVVNDPGYHVVDGSDVVVPAVAGKPPVVTLRGVSTLRIVVTAADSGAPVETFEAHLSLLRYGEREGEPWPVSTSTRPARMGSHPGGRLELETLLAGEYRLELRSSGFTDFEQSIGAIAPGETRTVDVRLTRRGSISGRVVDDDGAPVVGVKVGAYEPATREGASPRRFHTLATSWNVMQPGPWVHSEVARVETDEEGRFRLGPVDAGTWIVRAYRSPTVDAVLHGVTLPEAGEVGDLVLVLPEGGWLDGQLVLPPGAQCQDMTARAWQLDGEEAVTFAHDDVPVAADGRFRVGPFAPGEVAVWLTVKGSYEPVNMAYLPGQFDPAPFEAGRATIPAVGDVAVRFDLSEAFPARVEVAAVVDGQPASGAWLQLFDAEGGAHLATAVAGVDGSAVLGPFFATEARAVVAEAQGRWLVVSADTVTPPPGGVGRLEVSATIVHGELTLLDAASLEPLRSEIVCVYRELPLGWAPGLMRTDASGKLALELPPTRLRLHFVGEAGEWMMPKDGVISQRFFGEPPYPAEPDESMPLVEWTASGPAIPQVELKR